MIDLKENFRNLKRKASERWLKFKDERHDTEVRESDTWSMRERKSSCPDSIRKCLRNVEKAQKEQDAELARDKRDVEGRCSPENVWHLTLYGKNEPKDAVDELYRRILAKIEESEGVRVLGGAYKYNCWFTKNPGVPLPIDTSLPEWGFTPAGLCTIRMVEYEIVDEQWLVKNIEVESFHSREPKRRERRSFVDSIRRASTWT